MLGQRDSLKTTEVEHMRFKDTLKQKYKHEENPQVRKRGVDAVHGKLPHRGLACERQKIVKILFTWF